MNPPQTRRIRPTLFLIGEGGTEVAFLKYLRSVYCKDNAGVEVTIKNANGKGPTYIINKAVKLTRNIDYDCRVVLLDTDVPWTDKDKKLAKKKEINLVGSSPCIEGLFLLILNKPVLTRSEDCKAAIKKLLPSFDLLDWKNYASYFSKEVLEEARARIPELNRLIEYFVGISK